jgi:ketosteroid isomerase-like protein
VDEAEQIVRKNNRRFSQCIRERDLKAIEQLYAEDAVLMPPDNDMVKGRRGTREFWSAAIKMGLKDADLRTLETKRVGDEIHEIGTYKLSIAPEGKEAFIDVGKYMVVWRADPDGTWKLHKDIWNSDLPRSNRKKHPR